MGLLRKMKRMVKRNLKKKQKETKVSTKPVAKKEKISELDKTIQKVIEATGWDHDKAKEAILDAKKRTGCAYKEYTMYKMYDMNEDEQETLFLISLSRKVREKYDISKETADILNHKELTNSHYSKYLGRAWCINTKISFEEFEEKFCNSGKIIYKPLRGCRGNGVESFDISEDGMKAVYEKVSEYPDGLVEEYVKQHPALSSLSPKSVNTIRIATISSNTEAVTQDGKMADVAYAALRIGGGTSIVDNFHSGGMVAAVDLERGVLTTDAADMEGNVYENHPVTGTAIKGFEIPYFREAIDMVLDAIESQKPEGYIGWDVAITEEGPVLIEINLCPGVVLLTMPYIEEKKGMKHVMQKYL